MNILVLLPGTDTLKYWSIDLDEKRESISGELEDYRVPGAGMSLVAEALGKAQGSGSPDVVAIRVPFGGDSFSGPILLNEDVRRSLADLVPDAPLHLPGVIHVIEGCEQRFRETSIVLDFETGFFVDLPAGEASYGISAKLRDALRLRRYGYHGIFHERADAYVRSAETAAGMAGDRVLSICLEPQPELAAICRGRPLMVTGGATPLEGLPGETTCGEIDPSIVLTLAAGSLEWGNEQINVLLTKGSGLSALAERPTTVAEVLGSTARDLKLASELFRYRILIAAGAAKAVMSGIDAIVFSGRYADAGRRLGDWLAGRLGARAGRISPQAALPRWYVLQESLPAIIAARARIALNRRNRAYSSPRNEVKGVRASL